jgi:hypothetical protein
MYRTRNLHSTTGGFEFYTERLVFLPFQARSLPCGAAKSSNAERNFMNFYTGDMYGTRNCRAIVTLVTSDTVT